MLYRPYAELYSVLQRRLFADVCSGNPTASLKSDYIRRYGIPARVFNAIRVTLEGRMSAAKESQKLHRQTLEGLIARAEKQLSSLVGRATPQKLHQKRRRLANLKHRLRNVSADTDAGRLRLCFGSKKLWRSQYDLEANGYESHVEWLADWRDARGQVPGRGVRVRHPDCTAQAAADCVSGASCSASCFVVTPGVR